MLHLTPDWTEQDKYKVILNQMHLQLRQSIPGILFNLAPFDSCLDWKRYNVILDQLRLLLRKSIHYILFHVNDANASIDIRLNWKRCNIIQINCSSHWKCPSIACSIPWNRYQFFFWLLIELEEIWCNSDRLFLQLRKSFKSFNHILLHVINNNASFASWLKKI